jgi:hypothetical protein
LNQVEGNDMTIQRLLITTGAAALLAVGASAPAGAGYNPAEPTPVTFLRSVELPGQTLPAGDYVFERVSPENSMGAVMVRSKRGQVQWLGLTNRVERRNGRRSAVELSEARQGEAPRVLAWFPTGAVIGAAFIY